MPLTVHHSGKPEDKRPVKVRDESGKTVATTTTMDKGVESVRRRYGADKEDKK
jgi:hypothetical protein